MKQTLKLWMLAAILTISAQGGQECCDASSRWHSFVCPSSQN